MKKIVVINGPGGCGKDKVIDIAMEILKETYLERCSSIDQIKEIAKLFGWNGQKDDKSRKLLSDLKDMWTEYNDGPFKYIQGRFESTDSNLFFIHVREPHEIEKIVKSYGNLAVTLLIRRPNTEKFNNHADRGVEDYNYDYIIENNGTLDNLKENVKLFLKDIGF